MNIPATADLLATIVASAAERMRVRQNRRPMGDVERAAASRRPRGAAFRAALSEGRRPAVIAECKRRSPSGGVLRQAYDPVAIASGYASAGAAAISVLAEPAFFDGDLGHLRAVREAVSLPVLLKDFVISEYQLAEAREAGADGVLLIVGALRQTQLVDLVAAADAYGLMPLVEVHDAEELDRALAASASVVGVNSRNLRTLEVDLGVARHLISEIPDATIAVAESGLRTRADLNELEALGYDAFLIGERFMTQSDPGDALRALLRGGAGS